MTWLNSMKHTDLHKVLTDNLILFIIAAVGFFAYFSKHFRLRSNTSHIPYIGPRGMTDFRGVLLEAYGQVCLCRITTSRGQSDKIIERRQYKTLQSTSKYINCCYDEGNSDMRITSKLPGYDILLVPYRYVAELARIPPEVLGRIEEERICYKYTKLGWLVSLARLAKTLRINLNRYLDESAPDIYDELKLAVAINIGRCERPTPHSLGFLLNQILSQIAARAFVGQPLCSNNEWVM